MRRCLDLCNLYIHIAIYNCYRFFDFNYFFINLNVTNSYILSNVHFHYLPIKNNTFTLEFKIHHFRNYTFKPMQQQRSYRPLMSPALNFRASRSKKGAGRRRKGWLGGVESTALRERRTTMTGTRKYRRGGMGFFVLCENSRRDDGLWHQTKLNIASSLTSLPCSPEYGNERYRIDVQLQEKRNI